MSNIVVGQANARFIQDQDSCSNLKGDQELKVEIVDAGGGPYAVLSTKRWAMDWEGIEALKGLLEGLVLNIRCFQEVCSRPCPGDGEEVKPEENGR